MIGSSKRTEDLDLKKEKKFRKKKITTLQFIYVSNVLSYHASPAESTVTNSFPPFGFCIFTPSECPGVTEIVLWFHFFDPSPGKETHKGHAGSFLVVWLCPQKKKKKKSRDLAVLLCEIVCCILLNVRLNNDDLSCTGRGVCVCVCAEDPAELDSSASPIHPPTSWSQTPLYWCLHLDLALSAPRSSSRLHTTAPLFTEVSHSASSSFSASLSSPLSTTTTTSISLSTCSASVSQRLSEDELHSFGNLPLGMIWWVREQINSGNINRIFTSIHQPLVTGYSYPIVPRVCAVFLFFFFFDGELAAQMKQLGAGDRQALVHLPCVTAPLLPSPPPSTNTATPPTPALLRDHPCSTVLAAHWVFGKSTAYLQEMSSESEVDALAKV